jgi:putative membrane protein
VGAFACRDSRMHASDLPALNAILNSTSAVLLVLGYRFIRRGNRGAHRFSMLAAVAVSALFLVSYLVYHAEVGSVPFRGQGWIRPIYFTVLATHVVLAAVILPFVLAVLRRALLARFEAHRRLARWVLPVWLYVSVSGVVVFVMLYHLHPSAR